ncbi:peptide ABC transporter substrate-binding protein [Actinoplanes sp. URMC 104]|uniref:peptide ABC transporter substrate-binding protein n=1 Tax=Actinoplanes sp. URMC 104 TaxID=3423409 RepID=UPI003F1A7AD1
MALYRDPADKRVFVPKRGGGVALNFGHPIAWVILICTTIIPFAIVAVMTYLVLS